MNDLISRQAALNTVQNMYDRCDTGSMQDYHDLLMEAFEILPSVDAVEVRHGRWVNKDDGIATCSVCGDRWGVWSVMKYCPTCGSRMDGET